jgi:hypothetical protein
MRILFDQGTPVEIATFLPNHTVRTTRQEGWETLANGMIRKIVAAVNGAQAGSYVVIEIPVR